MPFQRSPFQNMDAEALEKGLGSLGTALFGDPEKAMESRYYGAKTRAASAAAGLDEDELAQKQGLGTLLESSYGPDGRFSEDLYRTNLPNILAGSYRAGIDNFGQTFARPLLAAQGSSDLARTGLISAGQMPDEDFAATASEANRVAARNEALKPLTTDQLGARMLTKNYDDQKLGDLFFQQEASEVTPRNFIQADDPTTMDVDESKMGTAVGSFYRDQTGEWQNLPGVGTSVYTTNAQPTTGSDMEGFTPTVQTQLQKQALADKQLRTILDMKANLEATTPRGGTGRVLQTLQGLVQQGDTAAAALDGKRLEFQQHSLNMPNLEGGPIDPMLFDASLPALEVMENMAAYQYALRFNDRVSDADFRAAYRTVNGRDFEGMNLGDFFTGSQQNALARTNTIRNVLDATAVPGTLPGTSTGGGAPTAAPVGGPVRVQDRAQYDALPVGTQYVGPDGKVATKGRR